MYSQRLLLIILLVAIWSLIVQNRPDRRLEQPPCGFVQNADYQRVSWKSRLPVRLYVDASVPLEAYTSILNALDVYKKSLGRTAFEVVVWGSKSDGHPIQDGLSTIYWMKSWEPSRPQEQARTTLYWDGTQISEADVRINASNFQFGFAPREPSTYVDLESLVVHELGHVLGLTHDATPGSAMNISLDERELRRRLGPTNLASLHCEY